MQNLSFSVTFVTSAVSSAVELYQTSSDEIASQLKARGVSVYKAAKPLPRQIDGQDESHELAFYDYFTSDQSEILNSHVYIVMPNDVSVLSGLSRILLREEENGSRNLIILTPRSYWAGLLKWFTEVAAKKEMIRSEVISSIVLVDSPTEIIMLISSFREQIEQSDPE